MNGLQRLGKNLRKRAGELDDIGNDKAIMAGIAVVRELAFRTPVDESTAVSNWRVGIDKKPTAPVVAHYVGSQGSTRFQSAEKTISEAIGILKTKKPGQKIYISNSLSYLPELNDGSSDQAPAGFVEASVMVAKQIVKSKANLRKL